MRALTANLLFGLTLSALAFIALAVAPAFLPPETVTLHAMPAYDVPIDDEVVIFNLEDLKVVLASTKKPRTAIPIMFSHGRDPVRGNAAAGFIKECRITSTGLWCDVVWSRYGREQICTGAWRYTSPRFAFTREKDNPKRVHPLDLQELSVTNNPAIDGLAANPVPSCISFPWTPRFPV